MRRFAAIAAIFFALPLAAQPATKPLTRGLANALYVALVGGSTIAGTTTFTNLTISGACVGCTTGAVLTSRLISTTSPLGGGGDLSADRTLTCTLCLTSGGALGTPSSGTGTNLTGIPESGVTNLTADLAAKLAAASNLSDLANAATARANLGLGSLATLSVAPTASASDHTPTACGANTFAQSQSTVWAFTCASLVLAGAQFANQGTTTTVPHGNAAGNPSWASVVSADLNITATTCTNQFISALSSAAAGTCTALTLAAFPTIATNTVLVNATSGTAVPTAQAVSTCSGASNALNWTTNTGFGCNGAITASNATTATNATNIAITDDTSTNATMFPTWVTTASGNQAQKVSSTLLTFNPSTGNLGFGNTPSGTTGLRLVVEQDGNQLTKVQSKNTDAASASAAAAFAAQSSTSVAQMTAFGDGYSGTLFGLNLAGQSSVNNGGVGTVGFTIGSTNSVPVRLGTNATLAVTIDTSQGVTFSKPIVTGGTAPAVSNTTANSCGTTTATITGNDNTGVITIGATAGTNCTLTFVVAAPNRRQCTASNETTANLTRCTYLTTTTSTCEGTFVAGDKVSYVCSAY